MRNLIKLTAVQQAGSSSFHCRQAAASCPVGGASHGGLDFMPADSIGCWADLRKVLIGNFQGTYMRPGDFWDLKSCK